MTSTERRRTLSERLDPRNWSLVAKLAVVGLVPTVLALAIGAFRVVDQANIAEELGQGSGLVEAHQQVDALSRALQGERAAAVVFVGGNRLGDRNAVDSAQTSTDQAVRRATDSLVAAEQQAPQLGTAKRQAETAIGQLQIIRSQVATGPTPVADVTSRYTSVVQRTLALDRALLGQLQTSDTAGLATALGATATAGEALELERSVIGGAIAAAQLPESQRAVVNGAEATYQSAASDYQAALTPQQVDQFGNFATDPANAARQALRDTVMATPAEGRVAADPAAWNAAVDSSVEVVRSADRQAEEQFVGGRAQAAEQAGNTAGLNSVLLMLGLLLTIGIILLLGRQLVRSLRVLRTSALDVAERRLPQAVQSMRAGQAPSALVEPVPLESRDEIGEVARAFDAVHGQAIRLAADQAALQQNVNSMFVNLSRRSQALVERQLQLIEQLESNEQDPDQLSNLFQLDHLATRMRRNSENLLVLAGTDLAKRNVAPVQIVDVLRAAVSEVEQYQRVVVQTPPTATIAGRAANDVVHLLAELLDNATNFSPPDSQVVMSTTRTADESLLIEISDRGVGMGDSELSDANQRLSGPSEVDVSASRRMGLFVVGRLAARHRIGVRLSSASGAGRSGGLSASVTVPPQLVPSAAPILEQPPRDVSGTGAWALPADDAAASPVDRQPVPANGVAPGLSSVTGANGPVPPTFGSGTTGGSGRNGSAPKLPTRTPGSALRANPSGESAFGSTGGQGAAPNGSSVRGASAFVPSSPGSDGPADDAGSDVFTPASDGQSSGGYHLPGPDGPSDPSRDERWTASSARNGTPVRPDDAAEHDDTHHDDTRHDASDRSAAEDGTTDGTQGSDDGFGRAAFGAGAVAGAGAALAGVFGRRREPDDGPTTEEITRYTDDAAEPGATTAIAAQDEASAAEAPETAETAAAADAPDTTAGHLRTDVDTDADTSQAAPDHAPDAAAPDGDAPIPTTTARVRPTTVASGTTGTPADATTGTSDDEAPETAAGSTAVEEGVEEDVAVTSGRERAADGSDGGTTADAPHLTTVAGNDAVADARPADGDGTPADGPDRSAVAAAGTAQAPLGAQTTGGQQPDRPTDDDRSTGAAEHDDTDTTAFPSIRPPREPMGGARPAPGRSGPLRPAPARRPVMPGAAPTGQGPSGQGPSGTGASGPIRPGGQSGPAGLPQRQAQRPPERPRPAPRTATPPDVDALFAPAVPVEGDRGQLRRPGGVESARAGGYDSSQTTPIFEEIASAWFRSNRSVPVRWQEGGAPTSSGTNGHDGEQLPSRPSPSPRPATAPDVPTAAETVPEQAEDPGFASPADEVWRQAAVGADETEQAPDEVTSAGLPKRRPRARLLPGSAAGSTVLSPPAMPEARSAENVRGRLASYQQGVRQGRESRTTHTGNGIPEPSNGDRSTTSDHEENT